MTSRRSFLRTSLPSFGSSSVALAWFVPTAGKRAAVGLDLVTRSSCRDVAERTAGSPTFLGSPLHLCPALRPRTDRLVRPVTTIWHGPHITLTQGLRRMTRVSGLVPTASVLAVYASQLGLLRDHARLATGDWPILPDGIQLPLGCCEKFQTMLSFTCHPPFPSLVAHRV